MKSSTLLRFAGAALAAALVSALSPVLSAQTAGTYTASGLSKLHQGDNEGASTDFSKALELNSSTFGAYLGRGAARCNLSNFDDAIADYNQAVKLKPTSNEAYLGRGLAEFLQGNIDAAITDFTKTIELKPDSRVAYYQRALCRGVQTNLQGASDDFAKALELPAGKDFPPDYIALYGALFDIRNGHVAAEKLQQIKGWSNEWTEELGAFLGTRVTEVDLLKFATTRGGEDKSLQQGEALYFAGVVKLVAGDKATAKMDFQKSFDVSGGATVVRRLARAELDHG